jgi:hypothetical protein
MAWKEKHKRLLRDKNIIIKIYKKYYVKYGDAQKINQKIANIYGVSAGCIRNNLRLWGVIKRHGIKYLLRKMLLSD